MPLADGIAREDEWMARCAASGRPHAALWQGVPGFVVPRRYTQRPGWAAVSRAYPVQVRSSGGGLVPQGPGVWNLSLVWPSQNATPTDTDGVYRALCGELAAAFARCGLQAAPGSVDGSFCDGRFNLAVGGRKLVGTAQSWRRVGGRPVVLAHAVILTAADPHDLAARANAFEAALGGPPLYRAESLTSVARELGAADAEERVLTAIAERFARVAPPHIHQETAHGAA